MNKSTSSLGTVVPLNGRTATPTTDGIEFSDPPSDFQSGHADELPTAPSAFGRDTPEADMDEPQTVYANANTNSASSSRGGKPSPKPIPMWVMGVVGVAVVGAVGTGIMHQLKLGPFAASSKAASGLTVGGPPIISPSAGSPNLAPMSTGTTNPALAPNPNEPTPLAVNAPAGVNTPASGLLPMPGVASTPSQTTASSSTIPLTPATLPSQAEPASAIGAKQLPPAAAPTGTAAPTKLGASTQPIPTQPAAPASPPPTALLAAAAPSSGAGATKAPDGDPTLKARVDELNAQVIALKKTVAELTARVQAPQTGSKTTSSTPAPSTSTKVASSAAAQKAPASNASPAGATKEGQKPSIASSPSTNGNNSALASSANVPVSAPTAIAAAPVSTSIAGTGASAAAPATNVRTGAVRSLNNAPTAGAASTTTASNDGWGYTIHGMQGERVWLKARDGQILSLTVGDTVVGLGMVKEVNTQSEQVVFSSGAVIK